MEIGAQPVPFDVMKRLVETLPCGCSNIYGITEGGGGGEVRRQLRAAFLEVGEAPADLPADAGATGARALEAAIRVREAVEAR